MNDKIKLLTEKMDTEVAIITDPMNVFYFTGMYSDPHERLLALIVKKDGHTTLVYPALDDEAVRADAKVDAYLPHSDGEDAFEEVYKAMADAKTVGVEGDHFTFNRYKRLLEKVGDENITSIQKEVNYLRGIKDEEDKNKLQEAVDITEETLRGLYDIKVEGMTEQQVSDFLVEKFKSLGAVGPSFGPTVLAGKNAAKPHGNTGDTVIKNGDFLLIDFGIVTKDNYVSDMTRTFIIGEPDREQEAIYLSVLKANLEAMRAAQAGVKYSDIDKAARDSIEADGFGEFFTHRVGHGLGHDLHESPSVDSNNHDILEAGNVITIEPGIYKSGVAGVRIEDALYIDEEGTHVFNTFPKDLDDMRLK